MTTPIVLHLYYLYAKHCSLLTIHPHYFVHHSIITMAELFPTAAGNGAAAAAAESSDDGKIVNLNVKICAAECYARNESKSFPMSNLFIGDSRLGCKSDADEQLILHVAFDEFVKVRERERLACVRASVMYVRTSLRFLISFVRSFFICFLSYIGRSDQGHQIHRIQHWY